MPGPSVETASGRVAGTTAGPVTSFKGIPFARPPVGDLRFQPPQPAEPWPGVWQATSYGPVARQNVSPMEAMYGASQAVQSEDCLTLNVWTPGLDGARRPVLVWIHGGAFLTGSGSTPWYDGTTFAASGDVVVVTLNYRLGALGFLYLGAVAGGPAGALAGEAYGASGNLGLLDQVAALRWVRDNAASLGGDPANVTVFGESAGAMSLGALLGMPAASGLFHRAILQSGACAHTTSLEGAARTTDWIMADLGLDSRSPGVVKSLLDVPAEALLATQSRAAGAHHDGLPLVPVVDGVTLPRPPLEAVASGRAAGVDLLIGTNQDEMRLFTVPDGRMGDLDVDHLVARADRVWGPGRGQRAVTGYQHGRPGEPAGDIWTAMASDKVFRIPAVRLAEAQSAVQRGARATFCYLFTWASPMFGGALGSCHALEIPFVFDNLDQPGVAMFTGKGGERAEIARRMQAAWVAFARSGRPDIPGQDVWGSYQVPSRTTMVIGTDWTMVDDPAGDERRLWDEVEL